MQKENDFLKEMKTLFCVRVENVLSFRKVNTSLAFIYVGIEVSSVVDLVGL